MNKEKQKVKKQVVVFVCTGNTCRSPVAQKVFSFVVKKMGLSEKYRTFSMGLNAYLGSPISHLSALMLKKNSIPCRGHKSKGISKKTINKNYIYICMTKSHKNYLLQIVEKGTRVFSVDDITACGDIIDPYGGEEIHYQNMFLQINSAIEKIVQFLEIA